MDSPARRRRFTPRAARDEWCGMHGDVLRIRLRAPPADQKANRALVEFLAEALEVPRSQILIERGATDRNKHVLILGRAAAGISARNHAEPRMCLATKTRPPSVEIGGPIST